MKAPLFSTLTEIKHNPMDKEGVGPYPRGELLDMNLEQWLNASGKAYYAYKDGCGLLKASFSNLAPHKMYSIWNVYLPAPPTEPYADELILSIGERDCSECVFMTDGKGKAIVSFYVGQLISQTQSSGGCLIS